MNHIMMIALYAGVFFLGAQMRDSSLGEQAAKGSVTFWTSQKAYKVYEEMEK